MHQPSFRMGPKSDGIICQFSVHQPPSKISEPRTFTYICTADKLNLQAEPNGVCRLSLVNGHETAGHKNTETE